MTADGSPLAEAVWTRLPDSPIVLVPLGSTEQHGPHLPLATDTIIAAAVAHEAAEQMAIRTGLRVLVAPALPYGASGEHQEFPGTVSIGHEALRVVLVELIRSIATWSSRIVVINAHGGNEPTVSSVVDQMRRERHRVQVVTCAVQDPTDAHAGRDETSMLLHLRPELVRAEAVVTGNTRPLAQLLPELVAVGMRPVTPTGVLGDPRGATSDAGRAAMSEMVDRVVLEVLGG